MRMAEAAHRSTWSSMAMEFDPRIFDVWSWDVEIKQLAGFGVDGPPSQPSASFQQPAEGGMENGEKNAHGGLVARQVRIRRPKSKRLVIMSKVELLTEVRPRSTTTS